MHLERVLVSREILVVEDNPGDVRLLREVMRESAPKTPMRVESDGLAALHFLRERVLLGESLPALILLDLNLPRMDGRSVLKALKEDEDLQLIPVIVFTSSAAESDVTEAYRLHANCYISKPMELREYKQRLKAALDFWLNSVTSPE